MFARSQTQFVRTHGIRSFSSLGGNRPSELPVKAPLWKRAAQRPSTPFITLGDIAGSQAIHLLNIREFHAFGRANTETLKTVLYRLQKGEEVDVKKELGTGIPHVEQEWADLIRLFEKEGGEEWQKRAAEIEGLNTGKSTNLSSKETTRPDSEGTSEGETPQKGENTRW